MTVESPVYPCRVDSPTTATNPLPSHELWASDELTQLILESLSSLDLLKSAQVCRSWNRVAVQCILDREKIWNPQRTSHLRLSEKSDGRDALSALLISVHVKKLGHVFFELTRVVSVRTAQRSFERMWRLVDRMSSLRIVRVYWPWSLKDRDMPDQDMASLCWIMEGFFNAIVIQGCSKLTLTGFDNCLAKKYQLKATVKAVSAKSTSKFSTLAAKARNLLAPSSTKRDIEESSPTVPLSLSDEDYCRRPNTSRSSAPWISIVPLPELKEISKVTKFDTNSTNVFRPPFSEWTFALLKASPIAELCAHFSDLPDDPVERSLILHRLTDAVPNLAALYLDSSPPGTMGDIMRWASCFKQLRTLGLQRRCFPSPEDRELDLSDLDFPNLSRLESPPFFVPQFLKSGNTPCSSVSTDFSAQSRRFKYLSSGTIASTYRWTDTEVKDAFEAVSLITSSVIATMGPSARGCTVHIAFRFIHDFYKVAEVVSQSGAVSPDLVPKDGEGGTVGSHTGPKLLLELILPGTREDIHQGVFDEKVKGFLRLLPDLHGIVLSSNEAYLSLGMERLCGEQVEKFRKICPNLITARVS